MAHIRTWADIEARAKEAGFDNPEDWLTPAERQLRDAAVTGAPCVLSSQLPPELAEGEAPIPKLHIRADVLRYFILGGCAAHQTDDVGVWLRGAHITGKLDLDLTTVRGAIRLPDSHFDRRLDTAQTQVAFVNLEGCRLQGWHAPGLRCRGTVSLGGATAKATLDLSGADIGGQLDCDGASFEATEDLAFFGQGIKTKADVFLNDITAKNSVVLNGADIGGQLSCTGARFNATSGDAFFAQNTKIAEALFWNPKEAPERLVVLTDAHAGVLRDDPSTWPAGERTDLNGFTYDRIIGAPTDAETRKEWLERGSNYNGNFTPQPYTQLAKVLQEMGHERDAGAILMEREKISNRHSREAMRRRAATAGLPPPQVYWWDFQRLLAWCTDWAFRKVAGYGYRPWRSVAWLLGLIAITWVLAWAAYEEGNFAPNSAVIQISTEWVKLAETESNPAEVWSDRGGPGRDWETFHPFAYALDVVVPIVNFGQTEAWAPSTERELLGKVLWVVKWFMTLLGWIVTAIGAAAIAGIARRD